MQRVGRLAKSEQGRKALLGRDGIFEGIKLVERPRESARAK